MTVEDMLRQAQNTGKERVAHSIPVVGSGAKPIHGETAERIVRAKASVAQAMEDAADAAHEYTEKAHRGATSDRTQESTPEEFSTESVESDVRSWLNRLTDDESAVREVTPRNKMYQPRGNTGSILYDRNVITGLGGPAGTGKSRSCLEKLHILAEKYAGCRLLICRKTRESLTEAALMTYESFVLPEGHPALQGPKRTHRQTYTYPNGSVINVVGLDKPQKIMSTEYDVIYIQEAIECLATDVELLMSRLRNGVVPYQQIIFDCNPDAPTHWIYQQFLTGKLVMKDTEHKDNPRWFEAAPPEFAKEVSVEYPEKSLSGVVGRWTAHGLSYLDKLNRLSGSRRDRLRDGKWVTSEGQIYDEFSLETHMEDRFDPSTGAGKWIWLIDFGFAKPASVQMWWIDGDDTPHLWKELYITRRLVEDLAEQTLYECGLHYDSVSGHSTRVDDDGNPVYCTGLPFKVICDWDAEGRATFERCTGIRTTAATKAILEGIDAVKSRLKVREDGKPGIKFMRNTLVEVDLELQAAMQPICTVQEFSAYIWVPSNAAEGHIGKRERPVDEWNHGLDNTRYLVCDLDGVRGNLPYKAKQVAMMPIDSVRVIHPNAPHTLGAQPNVYGVHTVRSNAAKLSRSERILMRRDRAPRNPFGGQTND